MTKPTVYLRKAWEAYMYHVVPDDAEREQIVETRRAFYAGAQACFGIFTRRVAEEDIPETDEELQAGIEAELREFLLWVCRRGE